MDNRTFMDSTESTDSSVVGKDNSKEGMEFGLCEAISPEMDVVWGAEVPYLHDMNFSNPFDHRQDYRTDDEDALAGMLTWLNSVGFTKLKRNLRELGIAPGADETAQVESRSYVLAGSPKGTRTLYLAAWKKPAKK